MKTVQTPNLVIVKNLHQKRERKPPKYLEDYTDVNNTDVSHVSVDYCYRAVHGIPQSYSHPRGQDGNRL